jgi:hypothetical protein
MPDLRVQCPNWIQQIPDAVWAPAIGAIMLLILGGVAMALGRPLLIASLGTTVYMQAERPHDMKSSFYAVLLGHFFALGAGFFSIWVLNAWSAPDVIATGVLTTPRVFTCVIAVALTMFFSGIFQASHHASTATAMLVALGSFQQLQQAYDIMIAVVVTAAVGEIFRRMRIHESMIGPV